MTAFQEKMLAKRKLVGKICIYNKAIHGKPETHQLKFAEFSHTSQSAPRHSQAPSLDLMISSGSLPLHRKYRTLIGRLLVQVNHAN